MAMFAAALQGCATVRSSTTTVDTLAPGMTYYLPMREIRVSAERQLLRREELEKELGMRRTELETVTAALKTAQASLDTATSRSADQDVQANADARAAAARDMAIFKADTLALKIRQDAVRQRIVTIEARLSAVASAPDQSCAFQYTAKVELLTPQADTSLRLVANPFHSPLRDDDTKLKVNAEGLLSSANVVAADRTGDIMVEIASFISGAGVGGADRFAWIAPDAKFSCDQQPQKFSYRLDPTVSASVDKLNLELSQAQFPFILEVPAASGHFAERHLAAALVYDHQRVVSPSPDRKYPLPAGVTHQGTNGALFYRAPVPQMIVLRQCKGAGSCTIDAASSVPIEAAAFMLPQLGPISYVPMRSSAFVKTVDDVVFENGMLTSWNATRPSEVLEVVRLPVKILKAIVSVPAELIKLRVDLSDQEKGLAASQQAQIAAEAALQRLQLCLRAAGDDETAQLACVT
jgi:hypothetical protein